MIKPTRCVDIFCDVCGEKNTYLPESYSVLIRKENMGLNTTRTGLMLTAVPEYASYSEIHICPKCSPFIWRQFNSAREK